MGKQQNLAVIPLVQAKHLFYGIATGKLPQKKKDMGTSVSQLVRPCILLACQRAPPLLTLAKPPDK